MKQEIPQQKKIQIGKYSVSSKLVIWFCVAAAILLGTWLLDSLAKQRFADFQNEVATIARDTLLPAGGEERSTRSYGQNLLNSIACPALDHECPSIQQGWMVPIEEGQEQAFIESLIQRAGYIAAADPNPCDVEYSCLRKGKKDGKFDIMVAVDSTEKTSERAPAKVVSPKKWRFVDIHLNPAH